MLTILQQENFGGLQVLKHCGDWTEAVPIEGISGCNIGDLLKRWANGKLVSTRHRVLKWSGKWRFLIPIFCNPASDAIVDPRDFDKQANVEELPPIKVSFYVVDKN